MQDQNQNPYAQSPQPSYQSPQQPQTGGQPAPPKKDHSRLIEVSLGLLAILFVALFIWQFLSLSNERNNRAGLVDEKVEEAKVVIEEEVRNEFREKAKNPFDTYKAPSTHGSLVIKYPKTWSALVNENGRSSNPFSFTAHPNVVPEGDVSYALRAGIFNDEYSDEVEDYQRDIEKGLIKSKVFKNSGVVGVRLDGAIDKFNGAMVVLPLRDKTIKIWTESNQYLSDFNKTLSSLKFEP